MKSLILLLALFSTSAFAEWKAVVMSGDDSIKAFDNSRAKVVSEFVARGLLPANVRQLSANRTLQVGGVKPTSAFELEAALQNLHLGDDDTCLIFMTSHGSRSGWYIKNQPTLTPAILGGILDRTCGARPTVLLVSACYSGVNLDIAKPNRIILTAARRDRTSFGCGVENQYTYWDTCFIQEFPDATSWADLYTSTKACVTAKEGRFTPSLPQASFGVNTANIGILD